MYKIESFYDQPCEQDCPNMVAMMTPTGQFMILNSLVFMPMSNKKMLTILMMTMMMLIKHNWLYECTSQFLHRSECKHQYFKTH